MEEKKLNSTERDYNKKPIIIEDYNSLFLALFTLSVIPIMIYVYMYNPGGTSEDSLFRNMIIIIPIMMFPYIAGYFKSRGKRKIVLNNETISFLHENQILEKININQITDIRRTYRDIYHKSQYEGYFGKFLSLIFFPFALLMHFVLLINKLIFHIYKDGIKSYRFYDAIIVYEEGKFINILPTTLKEYKEVRVFFRSKKNTNIDKCNTFFNLSHLHENIKIERK